MNPLRHDPLFSFNDEDLSPYVFAYEVTRQILPERNFTHTTVLGGNGALVKDEGLNTLEITVSAVIKARREENIAEIRHRLASILHTREPCELRLYDNKPRYYLALFTGGAQLDREYKNPKIELTFLCPDPIAFGQARTQTVTSTQTVVNTGGTYKSYPVVTVTPSKGSTWRITNVSTGAFVKVDATFTGSNKLVLDMEKQRATLNNSDVAVDISSDFFALEGAQKLTCTNSSATLEWKERWL